MTEGGKDANKAGVKDLPDEKISAKAYAAEYGLEDTYGNCEIFVSFDAVEFLEEGILLCKKLKEKGASLFPGAHNTTEEKRKDMRLRKSLHDALLILIIAGKTYGEKDTFSATILDYLNKVKKQFHLIKMDDTFDSPLANELFHPKLRCDVWKKKTPLPPTVIEAVIKRLTLIDRINKTDKLSKVVFSITSQIHLKAGTQSIENRNGMFFYGVLDEGSFVYLYLF